ncbi:DUF397 domain-containing protein [Streptomyces sp. NPDC090306]|uniref:DUF397 domain-containing protein n=1 Tax=Streptomyces sp. NPDC090306 TaxID=3365961 RepID=UPI0037FEC7EB
MAETAGAGSTDNGADGTAAAGGDAPPVADDAVADAVRARKNRERDELYALDISGVRWQSAPGTEQDEERVEIAHLPAGAVAMRSSLDPDTVLRYTEAEWRAFVLGARDGEFDLEDAARPGNGSAAP